MNNKINKITMDNKPKKDLMNGIAGNFKPLMKLFI